MVIELSGVQFAGAPKENIVQNHLNIALLNVFYYLNGRYRHIFNPPKIFHVFGFPSWKSSDPKIIGIKRNFTTNVPKILDLKSSSDQLFSENWSWVPLTNRDYRLGFRKGTFQSLFPAVILNCETRLSSLKFSDSACIVPCTKISEL